jgi:hypothetical protein
MTMNLFDAVFDARNSIIQKEPPMPDQAGAWLGRLTLLYGVPFHYLVPDERMLPPESLRFFYIDPQWMEALLGGALSIGPPSDVRTFLDKVMAGNYAKTLIEEARTARQRQQKADASLSQLAQPPAEGLFQFSGFLLRSEIVAGWRGLTVSAHPTAEGRKGGGALVTLRLERLARDILFGVFEGHLRSLEIMQPLEGMHFEPRAAVDPSSRVLDVNGYRNSVAPVPDNSAELAKSLLAKPYRYTFTIKD